MKQRQKPIAIVTSASTSLGLEVVHKLLSENYFVFAFIESTSYNTQNARYLTQLKDVEIVEGSMTNYDSFHRLAAGVHRRADKLKNFPQVDVVVNIPVLETVSQTPLVKEVELDHLLKRSVVSTYALVQVLKHLMEKAFSSHLLNVYPSPLEGSSFGVVRDMAIAGLDNLNKVLGSEFTSGRVSVDSLCVDTFSGHEFYTTDIALVDDTSYIDGVVNSLHYLVGGVGLTGQGKKYFILEDGLLREVKKESGVLVS